MNTNCAFRYFRLLRTTLLVGFSVFVSDTQSPAQSGESRPIEFSEPGGESASAIEDQGAGAERRRLTELEHLVPKTFDFMRAGSSLDGVPAPRTTLRQAVTSRATKRSGLFGEDGNWMFSDPLKELLPSTGEADELAWGSILGGTEQGEAPDDVDLLDELRQDDWLVEGSLGRNYWEVPGATNEEDADSLSINSPVHFETNGIFDSLTSRELRPDLKELMGRGTLLSEQPSWDDQDERPMYERNALEARQPARSVFGDLREQRQPVRPSFDVRREEYQSFLGLGANPQPPASQPLQSLSPVGLAGFANPLQPVAQPRPFGVDSQSSLHPVPSVNRDSLFPAAPAAPQMPSVFDSSEPESPSNTSRSPSTLLGSPFYEPPRRPF